MAGCIYTEHRTFLIYIAIVIWFFCCAGGWIVSLSVSQVCCTVCVWLRTWYHCCCCQSEKCTPTIKTCIRGFLLSFGKVMSDRCWRSCRTLSDGKRNNCRMAREIIIIMKTCIFVLTHICHGTLVVESHLSVRQGVVPIHAESLWHYGRSQRRVFYILNNIDARMIMCLVFVTDKNSKPLEQLFYQVLCRRYNSVSGRGRKREENVSATVSTTVLF